MPRPHAAAAFCRSPFTNAQKVRLEALQIYGDLKRCVLATNLVVSPIGLPNNTALDYQINGSGVVCGSE